MSVLPVPFSPTTARLYGRLPQCYRDLDELGANPDLPVNLLSFNQASLLADTSGWAANTAALARAGTPAPPGGVLGPVGADGTNSLAVTQLGSGGDLFIWTVDEQGIFAPQGPGVAPSFPVNAGDLLSVFASFQPGPVAGVQPIQIQVLFFDLYGDGPIAAVNAASSSELPATWAATTGQVTVPAGAVWASLQLYWTTVPFGELHYVSQMGVFVGDFDAWPTPDASYPLLRYLSLLADQAGEIEELLDRFNYPATPTCDLTNPLTADVAWLPWLAQLVGVSLPPTISDVAGARDAIRYASGGWQAGTKTAVANAAKSVLTGTQYCVVADHYSGDMWQLEVRTRGPETPSGTPDPVIAAILAKNAKPAGVALVHTTYAATWATLESAYPTWAAWEAQDWELIEDTGGAFSPGALVIHVRGWAYKSTGAS